MNSSRITNTNWRLQETLSSTNEFWDEIESGNAYDEVQMDAGLLQFPVQLQAFVLIKSWEVLNFIKNQEYSFSKNDR